MPSSLPLIVIKDDLREMGIYGKTFQREFRDARWCYHVGCESARFAEMLREDHGTFSMKLDC